MDKKEADMAKEEEEGIYSYSMILSS